jgi:DNA polymerase
VDFETYYAADFSLSKLTYLEYISDSRFKVHGASIKKAGGPEEWITGGDLPAYFAAVDWANTCLIGHNLPFDAAILAWRYGITNVGEFACTLAMARNVFGAGYTSLSLGAVYGIVTGTQGKANYAALADAKGTCDLSAEQENRMAVYAMDDARETYAIYEHMAAVLPPVEMKRIDWTVRNFVYPSLRLDRSILEEVAELEKDEKAAMLERAGWDAKTIRSNDKFANVLRGMGVEPPTKISKTTGKKTYAFAKSDREFVQLQSLGGPVADLVAARIRNKTSIEETRAARLMQIHDIAGGWLPASMLYAGAMQTGRLSASQKQNLQNLGRKSKMRSAIKAPEGCSIVAFDMSQIELRINLALAGDYEKLQRLHDGEDLYCSQAAEIFNRPVTKADGFERLIGKIAVLSLGYAGGKRAYQGMLWAQGGLAESLEFCQSVVDSFRASNPKLVTMWRRFDKYVQWLPAAGPNEVYHDQFLEAPVQLTGAGMWVYPGFLIKYPDAEVLNTVKTNPETGLEEADRVITYRRFGSGAGVVSAGRAKVYRSVCDENVCQALARSVIFDRDDAVTAATGQRSVLNIHDSLVWVIPDGEVKAFCGVVGGILSTSPEWWPKLLLSCDGGYGRSLGDVHS